MSMGMQMGFDRFSMMGLFIGSKYLVMFDDHYGCFSCKAVVLVINDRTIALF